MKDKIEIFRKKLEYFFKDLNGNFMVEKILKLKLRN